VSGAGGGMPPGRVPTLTEVVVWPQPGAAPTAASAAEADLVLNGAPASRSADEQLIQSVLVEVQRQVDLMLEYRLREALTPLLTRAADNLVREARAELASSLRDAVARAVAQELARHRVR
jgi:hypothetical protein